MRLSIWNYFSALLSWLHMLFNIMGKIHIVFFFCIDRMGREFIMFLKVFMNFKVINYFLNKVLMTRINWFRRIFTELGLEINICWINCITQVLRMNRNISKRMFSLAQRTQRSFWPLKVIRIIFIHFLSSKRTTYNQISS